MDVGANIRKLRLARSLTQEQLARLLFVSRQTISHWESGKTVPDAQSLVMVSALFGVDVDTLMRGGVETMITVEAQERRNAHVGFAAAAGIGLVGSAVIAPTLVPGLGATGAILSLTPLATALAVAGVARTRAHADASLNILHEALGSNIELELVATGSPRELSMIVRDKNGREPYSIRHAAHVVRGERWEIVDALGKVRARVAYRLITAGAQLPSIEARVNGVGTVDMRKNFRLRAGIAEIWELSGCDLSISGSWLGEKVVISQPEQTVAELMYSPRENDTETATLQVPHGRHVLLAITCAFILALVRAEERRLKP